MDAANIAALLEPYLDRPLTPAQLAQISTYIDLLLRWNARINLTAIRDPEEIVTRHFGESLFMARYLFPDASTQCHPERSESKGPYLTPKATVRTTADAPPVAPLAGSGNAARDPQASPRIIDLGSGAGFPALPLKIWTPHIHVVLIESNHKKAAFLREVARALTLTNINVIAERAETVAELQSADFPKADIVTFRAVEKFDRILPLAATFLAPHARLALLISSAQLPKLKLLPALTWQSAPIPQSESRVLAIGA